MGLLVLSKLGKSAADSTFTGVRQQIRLKRAVKGVQQYWSKL